MLGKIKDFIYNFNDALVVLLIVAVAGGILVWRVDEIMAYPEYLARQERTAHENTEVDFSDIDLTPEPVEDFNDNPEEFNSGEEGSEGTQGEGTEGGGTSSGEGSEQGETQTENGGPSLVKSDIRFTVPSGSSAERIANLLVQEEIISSQRDFLKVVEDNNLSTKLQAGTFTIPANSTLLDIAKIIARQK